MTWGKRGLGKPPPTRHYVQQGDYWPKKARGHTTDPQFGVMQVQGYTTEYSAHTESDDWLTTFYVVDLALEGAIVREFSGRGRPGMHKVQEARERACDHADILNRKSRVHETELARAV